MLSISDRAALAHVLTLPIDPNLKALLCKREEQLAEHGDLSEQARFVIVQPGDTVDAVEAELGFSPFQNAVDGSRFGDAEFEPSWEWIVDNGSYFELVFVFSDSGFGEVLFVDKAAEPFADLCRAFPGFSSADY
jgi:hypothetical protein